MKQKAWLAALWGSCSAEWSQSQTGGCCKKERLVACVNALSIRRSFLASVGFGLDSEKPSSSPGLSRRALSASEGIHPEMFHSFYSSFIRQISH